MSVMRLSVAIMSSQKKKLYLKSSATIEFMMISAEKRPKAKTKPDSK
jgi:hypothetical protein